MSGGSGASAQAPAAATNQYVVNDSHFHLTNYIQEGTKIQRLREDHGDQGRTGCALRHSAAAAVVVRQHGRLRADLLPADRRAALLLLVHGRVHRDGVPVAPAGGPGAVRSDDHRLQSDRHVRRGSHPARADDVSGRVLRASASSASTRSSSRRRSPGKRRASSTRRSIACSISRARSGSSRSCTTTSTCRSRSRGRIRIR